VFALPASGASIALRSPSAQDEMQLAEAEGSALETGIALLSNLGGEGFDAGRLQVTDFEMLLLNLRVARLGSALLLGFACPQCRAACEISFAAPDLIEAARPRRPASVMDDSTRPGWFCIASAAFRLPTARDQLEVARYPHPERRLAEICLNEAARTLPLRAKVERIMEAMAPLLSREIAGSCPSCAATVRLFLSIPEIVVRELKRAAATVYEEIDLIARAYHWPEPVILSLPSRRRRAYADLLRRSLSRAA
jgi:hypothetical protein